MFRDESGVEAIGVDEIRAGETRKLKQAGKEPILKHSRWCLLKYPANLTDRRITRTLRTRLEPMKREARALRRHRQLLLNWFRAKRAISAGTVEGFNNKAKLTMRKSYGFRTDDGIIIALYHALGDLPEPKLTHEFC